MMTDAPEKLEAVYERQVEELLRQLHIFDNLLGFQYLAAGIAHVAASPGDSLFFTKELYPHIGRRFRTKGSRVERNIRNAIRISWERGGRETLEHIAGASIPQRPTNSLFILLIAKYIRCR